jgi:S1-C subfamily serine protease
MEMLENKPEQELIQEIEDDHRPFVADKAHMMRCTVRIKKGGGGGSGVIIESKKGKRTLILTNFHVVSESMRGRDPVFAEVMTYDEELRSVGWSTRSGKVIAEDQAKDLALVMLDDDFTEFSKATLWPLDDINSVDVFDEVWVCGATGGDDPLMSNGMLTSKRRARGGGNEKWVCTAQASFGNSGGPVFRLSEDGSEYILIGVVNSIGSANGLPLAHINMFVPMDQIMEFLEKAGEK